MYGFFVMLLFFLVLPRPPTSTLFPYTTLFRSRQFLLDFVNVEEVSSHFPVLHRSEEHTSELQSRGHLVCRLLLEKKKMETDHAKTVDMRFDNAVILTETHVQVNATTNMSPHSD